MAKSKSQARREEVQKAAAPQPSPTDWKARIEAFENDMYAICQKYGVHIVPTITVKDALERPPLVAVPPSPTIVTPEDIAKGPPPEMQKALDDMLREKGDTF